MAFILLNNVVISRCCKNEIYDSSIKLMNLRKTNAFKILLDELKIFLEKLSHETSKIELIELKKIGHKFKGSLGFFGLSELSSEFAKLEKIENLNDFSEIEREKLTKLIEKTIKNQ